jgi:hypothetical protein
MAASTWASPEIDARIIALKQAGLSHTTIAAAICKEFGVLVNKNMVLRRARTVMGIDRGEKAANDRLERKRKAEKAEKAARMPKEPASRPVNVPPPVVTLPPLASVAGYGPLAFNFQSLMPPRPATPLRWVADDGSWPTGPARHPCQFVVRDGSITEGWIHCGLPVARGAWCREHLSVVWHRVRAA